MRTHLIARHFVGNEATLGKLREGIASLMEADDLIKDGGYDFDLGLKLTVNEPGIPESMRTDVKESLDNLPRGTWLLYDPVDRGPGTSSRQIAFGSSFNHEPCMVVDFDLDQYPMNTPEALGMLEELTGKMERDGLLYGIGSRNVPVVLARYKRNSDLRAIHELFHSLTIGSERLKVPGRVPEGVLPAYAQIGESISGLSVVNLSHPSYPTFCFDVANETQRIGMRGFSAEYYMALKASQLGKPATGYVQAGENVFHGEKTEQEELRIVSDKIIRGQTQDLARTDIRGNLARSLRDKRNTDRLAEFYPRDDVEYVRETMLSALEEGSRT